MEGPPPTCTFPVSPETLWVMPCKPAPEVPVVAFLSFCSHLVCGAHEIKGDRWVRRRHPVFRLFGTIKALKRGARTVLKICKFVHTSVRRRRTKKMRGVEMEAPAKHLLFILEKWFPLELLKGKSPAD